MAGLDEMMLEFERRQQTMEINDMSVSERDDGGEQTPGNSPTPLKDQTMLGFNEMMFQFEQQQTISVDDQTSAEACESEGNHDVNNVQKEDYNPPLPNLAFVDARGSLEGVRAKTLGELEDLYHRHARNTGFSVRRATQRGGQVIQEKYFCCACEGFSKVEKSSQSTTITCNKQTLKRKVYPHTRSGCKANIRCKLDKNGFYVVMHHNMSHNHEMTRLEWQYLHRSERNITIEKAKVIATFEDAGIGPTDSYRYWSTNAGGDENVGHTLEDHINFVNRLRMEMIEGGDANTVIQQLSDEAAKDPDFFFRIKRDNNGKLISIFWCDSMMRKDYIIYGDILIFDTTYRTNRYNLICAPFVGVNNHWNNVMFGCAFIADEKIDSFVWLLETFKEAMGGKCPTTIFTDQDHAIASAIQQTLPSSRHRLCLWHLQKNAISHFGTLKTTQGFKDVFNKCLSGCTNKEEFEACWKDMVATYELKKNPNYPWFSRLYAIRDKWCTALSKDFFSAGILSSQRSESTNNALGFQANKSTSLTQFYKIFKHTVTRWRKKELKLEFYCSKSTPDSDLPLCGLLKHASEVYTFTLFRDFEQEFKVAMGTFTRLVCEDGSKKIYEVAIEGCTGSENLVTYELVNELVTVSCSCKNFEETGWLCCHCIRILHMHSISRIPQKYILQRWSRIAKKNIWDRLYGGKPDDASIPKLLTIPWRHEMVRSLYNIVLSAEESVETRVVVEDGARIMIDAIEKKLTSMGNMEAQHTHSTNDVSQDMCGISSEAERVGRVLDPARSTTKGRSKRIRGHFSRRKAGSSSGQHDSRQCESRSVIPNRHLI